MKLLIIEDEKRPRDGLFNLIKEEFHGLTLLSPAVNGQEGLSIIETEFPEIIITDIQMPDLNGLDMIKGISKDNYSPYIIVISGYSNFEYARESLSLGVREYILKPFTRDSIISTISKAILSVGSSDYLSGIMNNQNIDSSKSGYFFLFKYSSGTKYEELYIFLRSLLAKFSNKNYSIDEFCDLKKYTIAFFVSSSNEELEYQTPNISEISHRLQHSKIDNFIGSWIKTDRLIEDQRLLNDLLYSHCFYDLPVLIGKEDYKLIKADISGGQYPYKEEKELITALYKRDIIKAQKTFLYLLEILISQEKSPLQIIEHMDRLIFTMLNTLKEVSPSVFLTISAREYNNKLRESLCKPDIISLFNNLINCFSVETKSEEIKNPLVSRVITYLSNHINEPLTLDETADQFQITPEHLSRLFKDEVGIGFNHYTNNCKIEVAKEKLQEGEMNVLEIANCLSFSSSGYFSKVFKRITSYTPKEYRELL